MQSNYHTHTSRCHHAEGKDEQYVLSAIENGYAELGFSDHACWKYDSRFKSRIRMSVREFNGYKKSVLKLKEKYKDQISIKLGMEAEYFPKYMDWLMDFAAEQDLDYLIFGNHYLGSDEDGPYCGYMPREYMEEYFDTCIKGMETGLYSCLCHPELPLRDGKGWDDQMEEGFRRVCKAAKRLDIPLEYNGLGVQANFQAGIEMYPHHRFWEIAAEEGCKAIIGMDAHHPDDLDIGLYRYAMGNLREFGIEIVDEIKTTNFKALKAKRDKKRAEEQQK